MSRRGWDGVTEEVRARMRAIRGRDTKPELAVRKLVWALGHRYRLNIRVESAKPDLVFKNRRKVIFVHGCFWHQHQDCRRSHVPASRVDYWRPKLDRNRARDAEQLATLLAAGWDVAVIWECELACPDQVSARLQAFLNRPAPLKRL